MKDTLVDQALLRKIVRFVVTVLAGAIMLFLGAIAGSAYQSRCQVADRAGIVYSLMREGNYSDARLLCSPEIVELLLERERRFGRVKSFRVTGAECFPLGTLAGVTVEVVREYGTFVERMDATIALHFDTYPVSSRP